MISIDIVGMRIGTSVIPPNRECEHFLVTGSPADRSFDALPGGPAAYAGG
jgi:hypothetical protein